jgi:linoleoyl-CoA desaturase
MSQRKGKVKFAKGQNDFYLTVKKRVNEYFECRQLSPYANAEMVVKTVVILTVYLACFVLLLSLPLPFWGQLICWAVMGLSTAVIGMCIMHDANHSAYSSHPRVNTWLSYSINLLGGIMHNWKLQHNILHHTYTNIAHMDDDIEPKGGMRLTPHHPHKKSQSVQYLYAFGLYAISTLYWMIAKDFLQFFRYRRNGVNPNRPRQNRSLFLRMVLVKAAYFGSILGLPVWIGGIAFWQVVLGFLLLHIICGLALSVVFQLAHTVEGTQFPLPGEEGSMENNWAIHQMHTTSNFAPDSRILSWLLGGLNFQVEHHLFPRICHVHYPALSRIVKQTAAEFDVPYLENKTFGQAFRSHVRTLKKTGHAGKTG